MAMQDNINVGDLYGRLEVISLPYRKENKRWYATCKCTCEKHTIKEVRIDSLISGHIKGCGCLQIENGKKQGKLSHKTNKYDLSNSYGIGYTSNYNEYGENYFYFDLEDYDKIKDYCWCFDKDGYLMSMSNQKNIKMHRIIMNCPDNLEIDHIRHRDNGGGTENDNRKCNLRICEHYQNCANRKSGRNTSGCTGVGFYHNLWCASISVDGETIQLGKFKEFEDAVKARKEAEEKYFGEYSYDNSMSMAY